MRQTDKSKEELKREAREKKEEETTGESKFSANSELPAAPSRKLPVVLCPFGCSLSPHPSRDLHRSAAELLQVPRNGTLLNRQASRATIS